MGLLSGVLTQCSFVALAAGFGLMWLFPSGRGVALGLMVLGVGAVVMGVADRLDQRT